MTDGPVGVCSENLTNICELREKDATEKYWRNMHNSLAANPGRANPSDQRKSPDTIQDLTAWDYRPKKESMFPLPLFGSMAIIKLAKNKRNICHAIRDPTDAGNFLMWK